MVRVMLKGCGLLDYVPGFITDYFKPAQATLDVSSKPLPSPFGSLSTKLPLNIDTITSGTGLEAEVVSCFHPCCACRLRGKLN